MVVLQDVDVGTYTVRYKIYKINIHNIILIYKYIFEQTVYHVDLNKCVSYAYVSTVFCWAGKVGVRSKKKKKKET